MEIQHLNRNGSRATVARQGAELQSLRLAGHELIWQAGPLWPRHAPLLFPIIGALNQDQLRLGARRYDLPRHGFARDRSFTWLDTTEEGCTLVLKDDAQSRAHYPFPFHLQVSYHLASSRLCQRVRLKNSGPEPLPASLGLHPAFRWPLVDGIPKADHRLIFEREEAAPFHRLDAHGLLDPRPRATPIQNRVLILEEGLFGEDALVFLEPRSRSVRLEAGDGLALRLSWEGFPQLGLWAKPVPGPAFLCIEPWTGHADPVGWDGPFQDKPGAFLLAPGDTRSWSFTIALDPMG